MSKGQRLQRSASLWVGALILLPILGCAPAANSGPDESSAPSGAVEPAAGSGEAEEGRQTRAVADPAAETASGARAASADENATTASTENRSEPSGDSQPDDSPSAQAATSETPEAPAAESGPTASDASVFHARGVVTYDGPPPVRRVINMNRDEKCVEIHGDDEVLNEDIIVSDTGAMQNAFVYVRGGAPKKDYPVPEEIGVLDQKGCMYRPRVQGILVGQTFQFKNSDPLLHNVRGYPTRNRPFNMGQKPGSEPRERVFKRGERPVEVNCDVHTWMRGYIFVMEHPFFAVTGDDGTFSIDGLPPGEYTLAAWHEKYRRELRHKITIGEEDVVDVKFTFESLSE